MKRIEGTAIVAYWLIGSGVMALVRLFARSGDIVAHPAGWRAAAGPLAAVLLGLGAAWQLLRNERAVRLPAVLLGMQSLALSLGPLAYRLDTGPFLRIVFGDGGVTADVGNDAHLLLILGSGNQVPSSVAINVLAIAALGILVASQQAPYDACAV